MTSRTKAYALPLGILTFAAGCFVATAVVLPLAAHAQLPGNPNPQNSPLPSNPNPAPSGGGETLVNPLKGIQSLPELIDKIIQGVVQLAGIALMIALVIVGFRFVAAQGNPAKIQKARTALMWTLLGGLILLGASGISRLIAETVQNL